ncbi:MAG: T9SS type A sorting domain-containing protein [Bacteroidota bacterium]
MVVQYLYEKFSIAAEGKDAFKKKLLFILALLFTILACSAQYNVTEIITDYNGYWKSSTSSINSVKPDNSHNLVSFSYNGNRYSTGVNDELLTSKGQSFIPGDYRALPVNILGSAVTSNTKIGLGSMYDGVANGAGTPRPINNIPYYLTDGIKGLDLGTCVANLPAGTLLFPVGGILSSSVGDNIPDVVITQVADPSGSMDRYSFTDVNGNLVGNYVDIVLTNIPSVGNWTADFYDASTNPMTLTSGFTKTDRNIRLWASDLISFGINSSNASKVAYFKITLSGNSDVAFVAYNTRSLNLLSSLLPVKLNNFSGKEIDHQVQLNWQTLDEVNSDAFVVERSSNGTQFTTIDNVPAAGHANIYTFTDKIPANGNNYYRLRMVDKDGKAEYSKIIVVNCAANTASLSLYPNPASSYIVINHPFAGNNEQIRLISLQGNLVLQQKINPSSFQTRIILSGLRKGLYELVWTNGKETSTNKLMIQ